MAFRKALAGAAAAAASAAAALLLAQGAAAAVISPKAGIVVINTNLAYQNAAAAGTGMVLSSSGLVLTNNHVIKGATTIKVVVPVTHRSYTATVLGYDTGNDVALLQLQGAKNLKTVTLGNSSKAKTGQSVTAIGNAGGTGVLTSATGRVTALRQAITASDEDGSSEQLTGLIQTNAGLQPGDSGGPLEDATGHVLGMDTAASSGFVMESQGNEAYAIPINKAVTIAKQIESGHSETAHIGATAFLGVSVESVDQGGGGAGPGALIAETVPGGPADQAGLVAGDVIVSFGGETVDSPTTLGALVLKHLPGDSVAVVYVDQLGDQQTITVTLGSGPPQ
jgi:S1-C subfamily serine protease